MKTRRWLLLALVLGFGRTCQADVIQLSAGTGLYGPHAAVEYGHDQHYLTGSLSTSGPNDISYGYVFTAHHDQLVPTVNGKLSNDEYLVIPTVVVSGRSNRPVTLELKVRSQWTPSNRQKFTDIRYCPALMEMESGFVTAQGRGTMFHFVGRITITSPSHSRRGWGFENIYYLRPSNSPAVGIFRDPARTYYSANPVNADVFSAQNIFMTWEAPRGLIRLTGDLSDLQRVLNATLITHTEPGQIYWKAEYVFRRYH